MILQSNPFWPKHAFKFGGDGGGSAVAAAPVPAPAPPVTADAPEVLQAQQDMAQQNLLKKSIKNTILAGDTGGPMGPGAAPAGPGQVTAPATGFKAKLG